MRVDSDDRWNKDRRRLIFRINLCLVLFVVVLVVFEIWNEYDRLIASGHRHQADRMIMALVIALVVVTPILLMIGWFFVLRFGRQVSIRLDDEFEDSIAHLSHEEQMSARFRREWMRGNSPPSDPV